MCNWKAKKVQVSCNKLNIKSINLIDENFIKSKVCKKWKNIDGSILIPDSNDSRQKNRETVADSAAGKMRLLISILAHLTSVKIAIFFPYGDKGNDGDRNLSSPHADMISNAEITIYFRRFRSGAASVYENRGLDCCWVLILFITTLGVPLFIA